MRLRDVSNEKGARFPDPIRIYFFALVRPLVFVFFGEARRVAFFFGAARRVAFFFGAARRGVCFPGAAPRVGFLGADFALTRDFVLGFAF
jgi:hypothetical protein